LENLRCVWDNCARAGARNLVIARVIETTCDLDAMAAAISGSAPQVRQVSAGDAVLQTRVGNREIGSGRLSHERRAIELSRILAEPVPVNFRINTDHRSVPEIATEIIELVAWIQPDNTNANH